MSSVFVVTYDLNRPGQNYDGLYDAIKEGSAWWHYLDSTWLIDIDQTATQIADRLRAKIDNNDRLLVIKVAGGSANRDGWLSEDAWKWIREHSD